MNRHRSPPVSREWLEITSKHSDVMKCLCYDVTEVLLAYVIAGVASVLGTKLDLTTSFDLNMDATTLSPSVFSLTTQPSPHEEVCCSGVLGYASDNISFNYPCQGHPCCNNSETVAVVSIDYAMGFKFQCMPRNGIQPLCYEYGAEVRTTNQDPDFIPRACCPGLKFKVVLNQWYAAMVVKCVEEDEADDDYS